MRILTILLVAASLAFVGCGGDDAGNGGGAAPSGPEGTYVLDAGAVREYVEKEIAAAKADPERAAEVQMMEAFMAPMLESLEQMNVELKLESGGKWTGTFADGEETSVSTGTWKMDGDTITFVTLTEDGEPSSDQEERKIRYEGDKLVLEEEGAPMAFVLRRK